MEITLISKNKLVTYDENGNRLETLFQSEDELIQELMQDEEDLLNNL